MPIFIEMPRLSDTMTEGTLIRWHVNEGDRISVGDVIADIETDKATMEVESFDEGILGEIYVIGGERAPLGSYIAVLLTDGEELPTNPEGRLIHEITIPSVGESVSSGTISQWHKANNAPVYPGDILLTLETDKISTEIESNHEGLLRVLKQEGEEVEIGATVGQVVSSPWLSAGFRVGSIKLFRSPELNVSNLGLTTKDLENLIPQLSQLTWLTCLDLSKNQLTSLPDIFSFFPTIETLRIRQNKLETLPESVGQMASLKTLDLAGNRLSALPRSLGDLKELHEIDATNNQIDHLPESLGLPSSLHVLVLSQNRITELPESIGQLSSLRTLNLASNQLQSLPDSFCRLSLLVTLDLSDNNLVALPKCITELTELTQFFLDGNPDLGIPAEILEPEKPSQILDYYHRIIGRDGAPLNEVKFLLVGRGEAGKSSIRDRLIDHTFDPNRSETPGIDIRSWRIEIDDETITAHVWDFAGQQITHATHQFFLTERSLYLLVLDGRAELQDADAEYWLRIIHAFGGDSPVIVALNKYDSKAFGVDEFALREKYPNIHAFIPTDCASGLGLDELRETIRMTIRGMDAVKVRFPATWWQAKDRFSNWESHELPDYLPLEEFRRECAEQGEQDPTEQDKLMGYLKQLGVVLHYGEQELRDFTVLNPHWVTNSVYRLLRHKEGPESDGVLKLDEACRLLSDDSLEMVEYLIHLMRRFELCFPIDGQPNAWLVPEALPRYPTSTVRAEEWHREGTLRLRYQYNLLPEGLMPRFITRTYPLSQGSVRWRYGVVLRLANARALIRADAVEGRVEIYISGEDQQRLAMLVRGHFDHINRNFGGLKPQGLIEVQEHKGVYKSIDTLERDELAGAITTIETVQGSLPVDQGRELDRISPKQTRIAQNKPLRLFVSYSHEDAALYDVFQQNLILLEQSKLIQHWSDRLIPPGDKWDQTIRRELEEADIVVILVSTPFLISCYIQGVELKRAVELSRERGLKIVPIPLEKCGIKHNPLLREFKMILVEGLSVREWVYQAPVRRFQDAFNLVEEGLTRTIEELRSKDS